MKKLILLSAIFFTVIASAQQIKNKTVEASCGTCKFGMKAKDCTLAVKIDGKSYFVDGAKLDDYGNPHAADGMCEVVRQAVVTGDIKDGRFKAKSFKLLPAKK